MCKTETMQENSQDMKIATTIDINYDTRDLVAFANKAEKLCNEYKGYIEYSDLSNDSYNITLHLPHEYENDFFTSLSENEEIANKSISNENVTSEYSQTTAEIKSYQTEYDRLLVLMDKAESTADLLTIESRLSELRAKLDYLHSNKTSLDNKVDYLTIRIRAELVGYNNEQKESFTKRIKTEFQDNILEIIDTFKELIIRLIVRSPQIIMMLILFKIVWSIRRKNKKLPKKKNIKELSKI